MDKSIAILSDPALYMFTSDVDDSLTIPILAPYLSRIATTEGNASPRIVYETARLITRMLGIETPVHPSPKLGLENKSNSIQALVEAMAEMNTIIAIAPLTYLAAALDLLSDLKGCKIVIMGGSIKKRMMHLLPEFNFHRDKKAAEKVINHAWSELIIVPLDTTMKVRFNCKKLQSDLEKIGLKWLSRGIRKWCITSRVLLGGFHPHDVIAGLTAYCTSNKMPSLRCPLSIREKYIKVVNGFIKEDHRGIRAEIVDIEPYENVLKELYSDYMNALEESLRRLRGGS